jgi:hypothetical protein
MIHSFTCGSFDDGDKVRDIESKSARTVYCAGFFYGLKTNNGRSLWTNAS